MSKQPTLGETGDARPADDEVIERPTVNQRQRLLSRRWPEARRRGSVRR